MAHGGLVCLQVLVDVVRRSLAVFARNEERHPGLHLDDRATDDVIEIMHLGCILQQKRGKSQKKCKKF